MQEIQITDAELEIMKILWNAPDAMTSGDIRERLDKNWERTTVLTLLSRLSEKGAVSVKKDGKTNSYKALVKKEDYGLSRTRRVMEHLYNGSVRSMMAALCTSGDLTEDDLRELRALLEKGGKVP